MDSKVALVTGASSGIGEATAQRLATAGYTVYGTSRRRAEAGQRSFEMLSLDVTSDESVQAAINEVMRSAGRIDLLVNNARVSVIEPAYTTQFDANFVEPDSKLDEYGDVRAALGKTLKEVMAAADEPGVVADAVLKAAISVRPKVRYTAGGLASRLLLLRRFAPASVLDAGIRKDLHLDAPTRRQRQ